MANRYTSGWTAAEDAVLLTKYPDHGPKVCAKFLPASRTIQAIRARVTVLGLKRAFVPPPPVAGLRLMKRHLAPHTRDERVGQSVEEWLANGGVIQHPQPKPFLRITPSAVKARPLVMPMRVLGRCA